MKIESIRIPHGEWRGPFIIVTKPFTAHEFHDAAKMMFEEGYFEYPSFEEATKLLEAAPPEVGGDSFVVEYDDGEIFVQGTRGAEFEAECNVYVFYLKGYDPFR